MSRYTSDKDTNKEINKMLKEGWEYKGGKKHKKLIAPNGNRIVIAGTPSTTASLNTLKRKSEAAMSQKEDLLSFWINQIQ